MRQSIYSFKQFIVVISLILEIIPAFIAFAEPLNTITFDNKSGEAANVKVVGLSSQTIDVPQEQSRTVNVVAGEYYILVRYGSPGNYRYTKGAPFTVTQTSKQRSSITITLHKVVDGNYSTESIPENEFDAVKVGKSDATATKNIDEELLAIIEKAGLGKDAFNPAYRGCLSEFLQSVKACDYAKDYNECVKEYKDKQNICISKLRKDLNGKHSVDAAAKDSKFNNGDYDAAFHKNQLQSLQKDTEAQILAGVIYENGIGVPQDYAKAVEWYTKAAKQGHAIAQCYMGGLYAVGKGVPQDYAEAVKWFTEAAKQGYVLAQYNLGLLYFGGKGVKQDYTNAAKWLQKAADQGYPDAQHNLGVLYVKGAGMPKDNVQAYLWFSLAADQGEALAIKAKDLLMKTITQQQLAEAQQLAANWKLKTLDELKQADSLSSKISDLNIRFFEGGATPPNDRNYATEFLRRSTRRIYIELNVKNLLYNKIEQQHKVTWTWLNPNGSERGKMHGDFVIKPEWETAWNSRGWGWDAQGNWPAGLYTGIVEVNGIEVGRNTFRIRD